MHLFFGLKAAGVPSFLFSACIIVGSHFSEFLPSGVKGAPVLFPTLKRQDFFGGGYMCFWEEWTFFLTGRNAQRNIS